MRVYVGSTLDGLRALRDSGSVPGPLAACAVTPALREWYADGDTEELEYVALLAAASASLRALAASGAEPRRVVLACDVDDEAVHRDPDDGDRAAVTVTGPIALAQVQAVHVDDPVATATIRAAVTALPDALAGDEDAAFAVDEAEGWDLLWYATQEIDDLLG